VFSRLCIVVVITFIVVVVVVVIKRFVKVKKLVKKIVLLSNNLVVVDINNKKATRLKLYVNKLTISTFTFFFFVDKVSTLYFCKLYYCCF